MLGRHPINRTTSPVLKVRQLFNGCPVKFKYEQTYNQSQPLLQPPPLSPFSSSPFSFDQEKKNRSDC